MEEDEDGAGEGKDGADPGKNFSKGVKAGSRTNATLDGETKVEADKEGTEEGQDKASALLAFYSKKLSDVEKKYSAFDCELLTAYSSLCHFRFMLEGREFTSL